MKSNILIVEDHELTRFGLKTAFESCDFIDKIYEAESAEKGLEIATEQEINLIIMEILKAIRKEQINTDVTIISNARHLEAIQKTDLALQKVESDIKQNLSPDLLSVDIRSALYYLGEITGTIANEDILENIFSKF